MWKPEHFSTAPQSSYHQVSRAEDDAQSDDLTLADDSREDGFGDDLPLTPDELSSQDPLDEKNALTIKTSAPSSPRWTERLKWWRPQTPTTCEMEKAADEAAAALMNDEARAPRWSQARKQTVGWLVWPLPSYTHRFFVEGTPGPEEVRRPTDYLDGLRGVASLFVFFGHYLAHITRHMVHYGYGSPHGENGEWNVIQLPFIRTLYSGSAMVAIFFVISGYVLAQRCVLAMRNGKQDKLHVALTSMTFRRGIRLFLPSVIVSLICLLAVIVGFHYPEHPKGWTLMGELANFNHHMFTDLFKIWDWNESFDHFYGPQLWTIPLEYRCSMVLFLFILMTARCTVRIRFAIEAITTAYLLYVDRWDVALFIAGMVLAEINIIADERKKRAESQDAAETETDADVESHKKPRRRFRPSRLLLWGALFFGVYLTGYPDHQADATPGYDWAASIVNNFRFWLAIASMIVVGTISFLPRAQALFTTPIARYLGKISYALYLVHIFIIETVMNDLWHVTRDVMQYKQGDSNLKFWTAWFIVTLFTWPVILWVADIFWRAVDVPTVKFAKWVEEKCFVKLSKA